ncbi:PIN domain nuclease [Crenothrix polyspora]|jgi:predicted nucleic acid-binding protein|uniref:Ribonuclease VapC n=1 Tax=Crenothrix polyspora TaxID=360316 RepID=A0A1R4HA84_9GAMM|nr:PIN domain nuclease [Crenothrix polyspora]SJM92770.1 Ribonuclease VapC [Crenothrix polyspora]
MTLVDTSVWIDFFGGRELPHVQILEHLLQTDADLALCGIVLTEVLQGISNDKQHKTVKDYLAPLIQLDIHEAIWLSAADIYRSLRKQGITIRKTNDCVIAATALYYQCYLLHNDKDFDAIQQHYPLQTQCLPSH